MNSQNQNYKTLIYEGELNRISSWVEQYPNLETGGDLFGFWTHTGAPVIQFVLGPGADSKHNPTSFFQDRDFLIRAGEMLRSEHGLQHIGEWHSHHQMDLARPSGGDEATVFRALEKYNFLKFLLCITNLEPSSGNEYGWSRKKWKVNVGSFLFTNSSRNYLIGSWVVLPGESPVRSALRQRYLWKNTFLSDPFPLSDSWRGVISQTTLDTEEPIPNEPIKVSNEVWYAKPEGKALLRQIYEELKNSFQNCQMLRSSSEQIHFTFEDRRGKWRIDLPNDYPKSPPLIQLNEKLMQIGRWDQRHSSLKTLVLYQINDIYYRGGA